MANGPEVIGSGLEHKLFCLGILPDREFRFVVARNTAIALEVGGRHAAAPQVSALVGEALLGAFFLATHSVKQENLTVSLQLECSGPLHRVLAFASAAGGMRAIPSRPDARWSGELHEGKGAGILTVHRWQDETHRVYSSSVEMRDTALAKNLEEYMGRSDQVQSFVGIEASVGDAGPLDVCGYLFQALPGATVRDIDAVLELVNHRSASALVETLLPGQPEERAREAVELGARQKVQVLRTGHFFSYCNCSQQKMENMLFLVGREKVMDLLQERGTVEVFCEFCKRRYELKADEVTALFDRREDPGQ